MPFRNLNLAIDAWERDRGRLEDAGIYFPDVRGYVSDDIARDYRNALAMDAAPAMTTTVNGGIPMLMSTYIDPKVIERRFAPTAGEKIFGEVRRGDWVMDTAVFPVVEATGEVSSYGDYSENGGSSVNTAWPQRQQYLFQTIEQYGERDIAKAGLAQINWVAQQDKAAAQTLHRFSNETYFRGVEGLQNYGLLNDPGLSESITPATKTYGGVLWFKNGELVATANEIYADIQSLFSVLTTQTAGLVTMESNMVLAMAPSCMAALTAVNTMGTNVTNLLKENFPNMRFEYAVQYGAKSEQNPYGQNSANMVQLIAADVDGEETGYCAFSEKMRAHPIVQKVSSWVKKLSSGSWGAIIRMPAGIASMTGV